MHYNCIDLEKKRFKPSTMYYINNPKTIIDNINKIIDVNNDSTIEWSKHTYLNNNELEFDNYLKKVFYK